MNDAKNIPDLEAALLDRAARLAAEYVEHGRDGRDAILKDERERLRLREERISKEAAAMADRLYRRRVQAAELRLHGLVDQQRWTLIRGVTEQLPGRLIAVADDQQSYEQLLQALLKQLAERIDDQHLVAQFNARDLENLRERWHAFSMQSAPDKEIELDPKPLACSGGVRVSNSDNRERIDATFEGRMERYRDELTQTIAEHLFAREEPKGS